MDKIKNQKTFVVSTAYIIAANIIITIIGFTTTLFIPKIFGEDAISYGYYQLYMLYISYIGFFHFGWCDGIFLKVGGLAYEDLDKKIYSAQFWLMMGFEIIVSLLMVLFSSMIVLDKNIKYIVFFTAVSLVFTILSTMLSQILQAAMKVREYAFAAGMSRVLFMAVVIGMFVLHIRDYRILLIGDAASRIFTLIIYIVYCRDLVFEKQKSWKIGAVEAFENTKAGIHLLISNISNGLIIDVSRIFIIKKWNLSAFGKLSLTLKIMNFIMIFINSVSLVLYPTLRRANEKKLEPNYSKIDTALMVLLFTISAFYYPFQYLFCLWLPDYKESLEYMALLFPICIYTCKMNMLSFTYMKVKRLENLMMKITVFSVLFALVTSAISVFVFGKMELSVLMIVVNRMVGSTISEVALKRYMDIEILKNMVLELLLSVFFIIANWHVGGLTGMAMYIVSLILYFIIKKNDITQCIYLLTVRK